MKRPGKSKAVTGNARPLALWSGGKLVTFAYLLAIAAMALLALAVWQAAVPGDAGGAGKVVVGWLVAVALGLLGLTALVVCEIDYRRQHPDDDAAPARQAAREEEDRQAEAEVRGYFRAGLWWFVAGLPGLAVAVWQRTRGHEPADWAMLLSLPLFAGAPLCWLQATKVGVLLWWRRGRPSRWLLAAAVAFAACFWAVWVGLGSYLRS